MGSRRKTSRRVVVQLDPPLLRSVESLMSESPGLTAAGALREILRRSLRLDRSRRRERAAAHRELVREAAELRRRAEDMRRSSPEESARLHLLAAVREIEGLVALGSPGEPEIRSALIEVVGSLKRGTGYRSLPDVRADGPEAIDA